MYHPELQAIYDAVQPINDKHSSYNMSPETIALGFKEEWSLGGDDGHNEFVRWLMCKFQYSYPCEFGHILRNWRAAAQPGMAHKAYNPWVYFALDMFAQEDNPALYEYDEETDKDGEYTCTPEMDRFLEKLSDTVTSVDTDADERLSTKMWRDHFDMN